jgi:3-hydroxyacyl-CoA dehydrogenase/enoyl-CoA hydratase/3-hydroxybutyryl-CoA epimerase
MIKYMKTSIIDGIATITLDDSGAAVNTVSPAWIEEMIALIETLQADNAVSGLIITSAKSGFMAGADLKFILNHAADMSPADAFAFSQRATHVHRLIETCGKPVVAAMNGFALGGGYELALSCTYRILADDPKAVVGLPEVNVGLLPGSGGTQRLPRMIGVQKATQVLLEGKSYAPSAAFEMGMVDMIVPSDQVLEAARVWLATHPDPERSWDRKGFSMPESDGLLKQATAGFYTMQVGKIRAKYGSNYPAPISILACVFEGVQTPIDKGLLVESRHFAKLLTDPVSLNIIRATFVNKGLAEKGARRPLGIKKTTVKKVGILGAGMMGAGIAFVSAKAGIETVLIDTSIAAAEKGKDYSAKRFAKQVQRMTLSQDKADASLARIYPTTDYADLAGVDLVIEAVFEDTALKADVTKRAGATIDDTALFASNTSTLPISQLAKAFDRPTDFIGLHFFSPVDRMPLVEVILGQHTSEEALARALDFVAQIRKTPIVVRDSRGFYTSRVFQTFIHEGMELLLEGVSPALIENVARQAGMPMGPLAIIDEVSLELPMKIVHQTEVEEPSFRRPTSMVVLEKMVGVLGRSGRKGGAGFYEYSESGKKTLWRGLSEHFPPAAKQPDPEEVRKRLLYIQSLETVRCLEDGVLTHAADGDLGSIYGWGFPTWTGGTLSLIDTVGIVAFVADCDHLAQRCGHRFAPSPKLRDMASVKERFHGS